MHSPTAVVQSRLAWRHSKDIDILISKEKTILDRTAREPRILLLGTSDCGKTTLLKQLTILHGGGYTEQDRKMYLQMIMENVFDCALALLTACSSRLDDIGDIKVKTDVQITLEYLKNKSSREILWKLAIQSHEYGTTPISERYMTLFNCKTLHTTFSNGRDCFQIQLILRQMTIFSTCVPQQPL
ncbi:hypothetical protein BASA81_009325 [Batrachochytrium salamandrivorans]|nr:hypothetical protein BASA81_009325 [Batrachochytrium salamandrivorans]